MESINKDKNKDREVLQVNLSKDQSLVIPVTEEQLRIGKKTVESGRVHISKKVIEEETVEKVPVTQEEVFVERKELNQFVDSAPPAIRHEGDVTIVSVMKEVVVKRLMLVEELHITKVKTEKTVPVRETLRREEVTVTKTVDGTDFELL